MAGYQGRFKRGELSPGFSEQGANYQGNFRRGELSPGFTKQGADFAGNIKTKRPQKGGGSVSGKLWNNEGNPIAVRTPKGDAANAGAFSGNLKAKRPQKGGGSVSGKLEKDLRKGGGSVSGEYFGTMRRLPLPCVPPRVTQQKQEALAET